MDVHVLRSVRQIVVSPTLRNASILVFLCSVRAPMELLIYAPVAIYAS